MSGDDVKMVVDEEVEGGTVEAGEELGESGSEEAAIKEETARAGEELQGIFTICESLRKVFLTDTQTEVEWSSKDKAHLMQFHVS